MTHLKNILLVSAGIVFIFAAGPASAARLTTGIYTCPESKDVIWHLEGTTNDDFDGFIEFKGLELTFKKGDDEVAHRFTCIYDSKYGPVKLTVKTIKTNNPCQLSKDTKTLTCRKG